MKSNQNCSFISGTNAARLAVGALMALAFNAVQAQTIYRIVGPDGKVSFSDKPPAATANASATNASGRPVPLAGSNPVLPYELRQVVDKYPVTLYSGTDCAPCASGRSLLTSRGIPHSERTVASNEDLEALQRLTGENSLPVLLIGGQKIKGFSDSEWSQYLDAAGYPKRSALPSAYRNPAASPLVAVQKPATLEATTQAAKAPAKQPPVEPTPVPAVSPSNPAGITF